MFAEEFLKAEGTDCTILRTPPVSSKVSMRVGTKSIYDNHRDALREGIILGESNLQGGEIFQVYDEKFLARSVTPEFSTGQTVFFASKINAEVAHSRATKTDAGSGNNVLSWSVIHEKILASAQISTAALRQYEPGLLQTTTIIFFIPVTSNIQKRDRFTLDGVNYQVDSPDDIKLPGIIRVQCSNDTRLG